MFLVGLAKDLGDGGPKTFMRYETALTLKCFKAQLSTPQEPSAFSHVPTARKIDSLFSHVRNCHCACVVATVDDLGSVDCEICKAYAVLHLKVHDGTCMKVADFTIQRERDQKRAKHIKQTLIQHTRGCKKEACTVCARVRAALAVPDDMQRCKAVVQAFAHLKALERV